MFYPDHVRNNSGQAKRCEAVRSHLQRLHDEGKLYITDVLCQAEPYLTEGLMAIDGHVIDGQRPVVQVEKMIGLPRTRVLLIDPKYEGTVKYPRTKSFVVPGTGESRTKTEWVPLREDEVLDPLDARYVLLHDGYPTRNGANDDGDAITGKVVEVAWLEAEVQKPECLDSVKELYERLKPRIEAGKSKQNRAASKAA